MRADVVRVVTYNVRGFRDGRARVVEVVRELGPDVLLLQETGSRRNLSRFTDEVDMALARDPWSLGRRRVKNAVLLAEPWRIGSVGLHRFPISRRWYPRGALVVRATAGPETIWAVSVHFGLGGAERAGQAASLLELAETLEDGSLIIGGDLNATPDMRATSRIAATLCDAWSQEGRGDGPTFPASGPTARIDYVFVGERAAVVRAGVGAAGAATATASDHLPVAVDLRLSGEPPIA